MRTFIHTLLAVSFFALTSCGGGSSVHSRPGKGTYCKTTTEKVKVLNEKATENNFAQFKTGNSESDKQFNTKLLTSLKGEYTYSSLSFEYRVKNDKDKDFILNKKHSNKEYYDKELKKQVTPLSALKEKDKKEINILEAGCIYGYSENSKSIPGTFFQFVESFTIQANSETSPTEWVLSATNLFKLNIDQNLEDFKSQGIRYIGADSFNGSVKEWSQFISELNPDINNIKDVKFYHVSGKSYHLNFIYSINKTTSVAVNINYTKK